MYYVWAILLMLVLGAAWLMTFFSLPGNWLIVAATALFAWLIPVDEAGVGIGWQVVIALAALAALGELIEFAAAALGTQRAGGSKRAAALAIAGAVAGSLVGAMLTFPIPVIGPIVGIVLFGSLGAMAGAVLGERWKGRALAESLQVGESALWGRLVGTLLKSTIGLVMIVIAAAAALV